MGLLSFVLFGFVMFMSQPYPPAKISGIEWSMDSEFHEFNDEYWEKEDEKLVFNNQSAIKSAVTLNSNLIPSEHIKKRVMLQCRLRFQAILIC